MLIFEGCSRLYLVAATNMPKDARNPRTGNLRGNCRSYAAYARDIVDATEVQAAIVEYEELIALDVSVVCGSVQWRCLTEPKMTTIKLMPV
jgi:hypothetical protein